jgi:hypothetical protein
MEEPKANLTSPVLSMAKKRMGPQGPHPLFHFGLIGSLLVG